MNLPDLTIQIDTREQKPLDFKKFGMAQEVATLPFGDYGIKGLSGATKDDLLEFAVERKSLPDLTGSLGKDRERFEREIMRMKVYTFKALVIEAVREEVEAHAYRSRIKPASVLGSLESWSANYGLTVVFCRDPQGAAEQIATWAHYRWKRMQKTVKNLCRE